MGSSAPAAPPPPDPVTTASAQSTANAQTASAQAALNNVNQVTPYGNLTYQQTGTQTITNPDGTTTSVPTYTSTQTLSAPEQKLFNQQNTIAGQSNEAASLGLGAVTSALQNPVTADNLPALRTNLGATPTLASGYDQGGAIQTGYDAGGAIQTGYDQGGAIQSSVPVQQTANTFGNTAGGIQYNVDTTGIAQATNDATNAALARLQPTMDQSNAALQSQLANQGVSAGSSAYNDALLQQGQSNNDLRLGAVATGDAEQQAAYQQALQSGEFTNAAQQQDYTQQQGRGLFGMQADAQNNAANLAAGEFANEAQSQGNSQNAAQAAFGNEAQAQQDSQNAQQAAFANSAQGQQNSENAAQAAFGNTAAEQGFQNKQTAAAFANSAREQSLTDQETINNNSVNQVSALMHGGQATTGQYQGYTPAQLGSTPISQDTYASAQLAEQNYQTESQAAAANNSAMFSALGGLFGMGGQMFRGAGSFSDRRLKRGIVALGVVPNGLPIYAYHYVWDDEGAPKHIGHMADEVALVAPHAVLRHPAGFDMVDYGAL